MANFSLGHKQHKLAPFKAVKAKCILLWNAEKVIKKTIKKAIYSMKICKWKSTWSKIEHENGITGQIFLTKILHWP